MLDVTIGIGNHAEIGIRLLLGDLAYGFAGVIGRFHGFREDWFTGQGSDIGERDALVPGRGFLGRWSATATATATASDVGDIGIGFVIEYLDGRALVWCGIVIVGDEPGLVSVLIVFLGEEVSAGQDARYQIPADLAAVTRYLQDTVGDPSGVGGLGGLQPGVEVVEGGVDRATIGHLHADDRQPTGTW